MAFQNGKVCSTAVPETIFKCQKIRIGRRALERPSILFSLPGKYVLKHHS